MSNPASTGWLSTLTPAQRKRVRTEYDKRVPRTRDGPRSDGWSVLLSPTTGVPRSIELRWRDPFGRVCVRIPIDASPDGPT